MYLNHPAQDDSCKNEIPENIYSVDSDGYSCDAATLHNPNLIKLPIFSGDPTLRSVSPTLGQGDMRFILCLLDHKLILCLSLRGSFRLWTRRLKEVYGNNCIHFPFLYSFINRFGKIKY